MFAKVRLVSFNAERQADEPDIGLLMLKNENWHSMNAKAVCAGATMNIMAMRCAPQNVPGTSVCSFCVDVERRTVAAQPRCAAALTMLLNRAVPLPPPQLLAEAQQLRHG